MTVPENTKNSSGATPNPHNESEAEHQPSDVARFFLAAIVESSQHSLITVDFDGVITTWNQGAEQIYGYGADEAIGQELLRLIRDDGAAKMLSNIEKVKHGQEAPDLHSFRIKKGGQEIHVEVVMSPVKDDGGKVIGVSTISRDVTQQRQMEEDLQRAHEELQHAHEKLEIRTQELQEEVKQRLLLEKQRTQLTQRILNVQEEERERVARELHDNLGQHLAAILLHIRRLENESRETPGVQQFFEERGPSMKGLDYLGGMVDDLMGITHRLAWELRPAVLDNLGLNTALEQYVQAWSEQGIAAHFVGGIQGSETKLSGRIETALYRVVQEAVSNVQRHARASQVSVILKRQGQFVMVIVEDDGIGFDVEAADDNNRLGLIGMREPLELLGGTLEIESESGGGTTVYARVPLDAT